MDVAHVEGMVRSNKRENSELGKDQLIKKITISTAFK